MKKYFKKAYNYLKDRITKKEISTFVGLALVVAGPAGLISAEQVELIRHILTLAGVLDPQVAAGTVSAIGAALVAYKEKK